jgi:dTDP-4-dehydrorhamnose 3,5-epimerase-like enzyme
LATLLTLKTHSDKRGSLTVIEKVLPFKVERIFYIYNVDDSIRGGHRHHNTVQAAICINGSCLINCNDGSKEAVFLLDDPNKCLILNPEDWHTMSNFTQGAILLVLASHLFDEKDYIYEPY